VRENMKQFIILEVCNEDYYIFDTVNEAVLYAIEKVCKWVKDEVSGMTKESAGEIILEMMDSKTDHSFYVDDVFYCYPAQYIKE
jgi:hypothetical protein